VSVTPVNSSSSQAAVANTINSIAQELEAMKNVQIFKDDATTRRVLLGKGANGFYGIKVSKENSDVFSAADDDLLFSSSFNSYTSLNGSYMSIIFDDWNGFDWYFESVIFTDAGTGYVRLYNVTDGAEVTGTEFSTTAVGEANAEYYRSSVLTKPTGTKVFRVQVKIVGGNGTTQYINSMKSNMVFRTGA